MKELIISAMEKSITRDTSILTGFIGRLKSITEIRGAGAKFTLFFFLSRARIRPRRFSRPISFDPDAYSTAKIATICQKVESEDVPCCLTTQLYA